MGKNIRPMPKSGIVKKTRVGSPAARSTPKRTTKLSNVFGPKVVHAEKIIGKRFINGCVELLVKWINFPVEESTWEPLTNFGNCQNAKTLLEEFEMEEFRRRGDTEILLPHFDEFFVASDPDVASSSNMSSQRVSPEPPKVGKRKKKAPQKDYQNDDDDDDENEMMTMGTPPSVA